MTTPRVCLIIPTYNHARTLRKLLRAAPAFVPDIIVVNNGSTDHTPEVLAQFPAVEVIEFPVNMGKGRALMAGLERAMQAGFTHAIAMDTTGALFPDDLPLIGKAVEEHSDAIVLGRRRFTGRRRRSLATRALRNLTSFWVWTQTGRWLHDTNSGLRAYPLEAIMAVQIRRAHYEVEMELLVKAIWRGIPIMETNVRSAPRRRSLAHYHPIRDTWRWFRLIWALIWQRLLLPSKIRAMMHLKEFGRLPRRQRILTYLRGFLLQEVESPRDIALSLGIGVFLGIVPIWGFQMLTALWVAHRTRLSKPLMVTATQISFGPALPVVVYISLLVGRFLFTGQVDFDLDIRNLEAEALPQYLLEYIVGSMVLATVAGVVAGVATYIFARSYIVRHEQAG